MSLIPFRQGGMVPRMRDQMDRDMLPFFYNILYEPERVFNVGSSVGEVVNTKEKFAVDIDVSEFRPEEVKIHLSGRQLYIEGNHEERDDQHGSIQRSFSRKYTLPEDVNVDAIRSELSDDGKLSIEAPKMVKGGPQSRAIPIMHSKE